jgi:hypothetical protein
MAQLKVIVDTSIWSLALRRDGLKNSELLGELRSLIQNHLVQIIGPIRQEILSGIRHRRLFDRLEKHLDSFPDLPILTEDYVVAARFFNLCRSKGVQGANTGFLICAVAARTEFAILPRTRILAFLQSICPSFSTGNHNLSIIYPLYRHRCPPPSTLKSFHRSSVCADQMSPC